MGLSTKDGAREGGASAELEQKNIACLKLWAMKRQSARAREKAPPHITRQSQPKCTHQPGAGVERRERRRAAKGREKQSQEERRAAERQSRGSVSSHEEQARSKERGRGAKQKASAPQAAGSHTGTQSPRAQRRDDTHVLKLGAMAVPSSYSYVGGPEGYTPPERAS